MGRTACTEPQCLYKGALYLSLNFIPEIVRVFVVLRISTECVRPMYTLSVDAAANAYEQSCHVQRDAAPPPHLKSRRSYNKMLPLRQTIILGFKTTIFCDAKQCGFVESRRHFGIPWCLHIQLAIKRGFHLSPQPLFVAFWRWQIFRNSCWKCAQKP
jgi:hypothetical protein